jgi:hypothetical protein
VKRWGWPLLVVAGVVALVLAFTITYFVRGSGNSVSSPGTVTASAEGPVVKVSWKSASGADSYLLSRGEAVVYSGPATEFTDISAVAPSGGDRVEYRVRAVDDKGRVSEPSASASVEVGSGWGQYAESAQRLPELLPAGPDEQGYNGMRCETRMDAVPPEEGDGPDGSGEQFIKAGFRCVLDSGGEQYDLWTDFYVTPEALESRMDDIRGFDGVTSTTWQNGRAVSGGGGDEPRWMALTVDGMPDVYIELSAVDKATTSDQLVDAVNSLPVG